jgi:hypothetical protein
VRLGRGGDAVAFGEIRGVKLLLLSWLSQCGLPFGGEEI